MTVRDVGTGVSGARVDGICVVIGDWVIGMMGGIVFVSVARGVAICTVR
jgi:hypothetical protein